jgi:hypothetical protein
MRKLVGKAEVPISLRTKDPREAARRWGNVARDVDAEWQALRHQPPLLPYRYAGHSDPQARNDEALAASGYLDDREAPEDREPLAKAGIDLHPMGVSATTPRAWSDTSETLRAAWSHSGPRTSALRLPTMSRIPLPSEAEWAERRGGPGPAHSSQPAQPPWVSSVTPRRGAAPAPSAHRPN